MKDFCRILLTISRDSGNRVLQVRKVAVIFCKLYFMKILNTFLLVMIITFSSIKSLF